MTDKIEDKYIGKWLLITSIAFTTFVVLWVIFMNINQIPGGINQQLVRIKNDSFIYSLTFINASLISITLVPTMIILALFTNIKKGFSNILGVVFQIPYTVLVSIGYSSQYVVLQRILSDAGVDTAKIWYFGNPNGIPYFLVFLGYTFFSISALLIGWGYIKQRGILKSIGWLLLLSGATGIIGFIGMAVRVSILELGMVLSGVVILPFGIITAIYGLKLQKQNG